MTSGGLRTEHARVITEAVDALPSHVDTATREAAVLAEEESRANPARHTEAELREESGDWKPLRRRLGEALVEYVERYPSMPPRRPRASTPPWW